jgi:hypothetical protein
MKKKLLTFFYQIKKRTFEWRKINHNFINQYDNHFWVDLSFFSQNEN